MKHTVNHTSMLLGFVFMALLSVGPSTIMAQNLPTIKREVNAMDSIRPAKNSIYFELLGSAGFFYNVSYDRVFFTQKKHNVSWALGAQYMFFVDEENEEGFLTFSPQLNYFYGTKNCLELGLGFIILNNRSMEAVPTFRIGYRIQNPKGGPYLKLGFTPIYLQDFFGEPLLLPWGGMAFGYTF